MMYLPLLEALLKSVSGAEAALLLDSEGEIVVEAGPKHERHRLIGAYQGLVLGSVIRVNERYQLGRLDYLLRRHEGGTVVLRPLKDGYYFVVALADGTPIGPCLYHSARTQERLNEEL
jgi:predicted regulator of Ras-like GTPase activity (Roadblock/LC7/MglB family)